MEPKGFEPLSSLCKQRDAFPAKLQPRLVTKIFLVEPKGFEPLSSYCKQHDAFPAKLQPLPHFFESLQKNVHP